jgi:glycosyltransferase involved in cell wall biosynthesis
MRKILLAAMSLDYGGAETHVIDLATELRRLGCSVTVASQGGRLVSRLEEAGIPHYLASLHSRSPFRIMEAKKSLEDLSSSLGISLLHAHGRIPAWVCSRIQLAHPHIPLVTTYHGVYAAGFPWNLVTCQGDISIAVSEDVRAHFVSKLGFDATRVTVIPNGIDTRRFAPGPRDSLREMLLTDPGSALITHVSRLDGQFAEVAIALTAALPPLDKAHPGICAVIVGDGDRMAAVSAACEECNRRLGRQAIRAVGGQMNVGEYLQAADVVVAVARSALEAMACEKPVVFAGEGGLRGAFEEQMVEVLTMSNFTARGSSRKVTPDGLAAEVMRFLDDKAAAAVAGKMGREIVMRHYSWDVLAEKTLSVYEKAISMRQR